MKKIALTLLAATVVVTGAGCSSKRSIDPEVTGSISVPGTSWKLFCDGPNAFIWIPGRDGEADELEAVIYDHYECVDQGGSTADLGPARDDDGIVEDEE